MRPIEPRDPFSTPPAPVYTGAEVYEVPVPPRHPRPRRGRPSRGRIATFALAVMSGLWVLALAASQSTSATVAVPFLERTIGALGDVPALLQLKEQEIRSTASQGGGNAPVAVPGFPVQGVTLPRALAQTGSRDEWRTVLLRASAEAAYERGPAVFAPGGGPTDSRTFSTSQWVRIVMAVESAGTHATASLVAWGLGLATLALAALVFAIVDGIRRFVAIGLALIGGAMFSAVIGLIGLLVAIVFGVGSGSDFVAEVGALIRTIAWAPVEDAARLGIAGLAIAVPAAAAAAWRARHEDPYDAYEAYDEHPGPDDRDDAPRA